MRVKDRAQGRESIRIVQNKVLRDFGTWQTTWEINKFEDPTGIIARLAKKGLSIKILKTLFPKNFIGRSVMKGNLLLYEGIQAFEELLAGISTPTLWDDVNARVGVGDSSLAADPTQTGLQGTNQEYAGMDDLYPQRSAQTLSWRGTFGGTVANFAWNEFTVDNGATAGINLNRLVSAQGTKVSGQTWILTVSIEITNPP